MSDDNDITEKLEKVCHQVLDDILGSNDGALSLFKLEQKIAALKVVGNVHAMLARLPQPNPDDGRMNGLAKSLAGFGGRGGGGSDGHPDAESAPG